MTSPTPRTADYCNTAGSDPDESFTYTLNGGSDATVSVEVTCVDDNPTAVNDSKTLNEDAAATPIDVLANDQNTDGGTIKVDSFDDSSSHGTVAITNAGADLTYTPDPDYCNTDGSDPDDSFTYTLNGGSSASVSVEVTCVDDSYSVGGTVSGLQGAGLTLRNNGGNDTNISSNGSFTFSNQVASGQPYLVTVHSQPSGPAQTCTVSNGSGTVTNSNVTSVQVDCTTNTYDVGGTVSGLQGSGLQLRNNGGDTTNISSNGSFTFSNQVASGQPYLVTVHSQPSGPAQTCTVSNGSGTVTNSNVTNVQVDCPAPPDTPPTAVNDSKTVTEDAAATTIDVLANDTDPDGGPLNVDSFDDSSSHGTVAITNAGADLTYTPDPDYCNTSGSDPDDTFTYTLNGGSTATVSVEVDLRRRCGPPRSDRSRAGRCSADGMAAPPVLATVSSRRRGPAETTPSSGPTSPI